jgi:hypothetical protein
MMSKSNIFFVGLGIKESSLSSILYLLIGEKSISERTTLSVLPDE